MKRSKWRLNRGTAVRASGGAWVEGLEDRVLFAIMVSNTADAGAGSLRQAILDANATQGLDEIQFDSSVFSVPQTITFITAPPQIGQPLKITGPGSSLLTLTRGAQGLASTRRIVDSVARELTITGVTITGGAVSGAGGGGINAVGVTTNVTLNDVVLKNNSTDGLGGGIYLGNGATLTMTNCVVSGNSAQQGGGIYFFSGGALVMDHCTINGNTSTLVNQGAGGGMWFSGTTTTNPPTGFTPGTLVVRNSTFSGNTSAGSGGGIYLDGFIGAFLMQNSTVSGNTSALNGGGIDGSGGTGSITLQDTTLTNNKANGTTATTGGGGIWRASSLNNTMTIVNSIVAGNTHATTPDIKTDAFTALHVNYSALGSSGGYTLAADSGNNLPTGIDLKLGALSNNGGPTQTHALLAASPLINAGSNAKVPAELTSDQRGSARFVGAAVDIGSFESQTVVGPQVVLGQFAYLTAPQSVQLTFNENVSASLSTLDLVLKNLTTGVAVPVREIHLDYDASNNRATFTFPLNLYGALTDGNYRVTLPAGSVTDGVAPLASDYTFDFFFLNGDANRDRSVGFADLVAVAQNYGVMTGATFAKGDFTYDGKVDFSDLVIVAQKYGVSLAPSPASALPGSRLDRSLFANSKISKNFLD